jgi:hypothetical protein
MTGVRTLTYSNLPFVIFVVFVFKKKAERFRAPPDFSLF